MTDNNAEMTAVFLQFSRRKLLEQYRPRLKAGVEPLTEEQIWWRPTDASNSVGNLILRLNGNVRQWRVDSFNGMEDRRDRPAEFTAQGGMTSAELLDRLGATMTEGAEVLGRLTVKNLAGQYEIQGYYVSGLEAVYQVVEHFGLHHGRIAYIAKSLVGAELGNLCAGS
jgi:hypothetical protein